MAKSHYALEYDAPTFSFTDASLWILKPGVKTEGKIKARGHVVSKLAIRHLFFGDKQSTLGATERQDLDMPTKKRRRQ